MYTIWLVVIPTPLKNMSSSVGMMKFPTEWKTIIQMFQACDLMEINGNHSWWIFIFFAKLTYTLGEVYVRRTGSIHKVITGASPLQPQVVWLIYISWDMMTIQLGLQQPKRMDTWIPGRYEKIDIDIFFAVHHPWEGDARQNLLAWAHKQGCPSSFTGSSSHSTIMIWLVVYLPVSTPLKNDGVRQLGWWHSQYRWESHKSIKKPCCKPPIKIYSPWKSMGNCHFKWWSPRGIPGYPVTGDQRQHDLSCPAKESSGRVRKWVLAPSPEMPHFHDPVVGAQGERAQGEFKGF